VILEVFNQSNVRPKRERAREKIKIKNKKKSSDLYII
jgi:hypothetical protein